MFGRTPRVIPAEMSSLVPCEDKATRSIENLSLSALKSSRAIRIPERPVRAVKVIVFPIGSQFLLTKGAAVQKNIKWPAFQIKFTGPYIVKRENHPDYEVVSKSGSIHVSS